MTGLNSPHITRGGIRQGAFAILGMSCIHKVIGIYKKIAEDVAKIGMVCRTGEQSLDSLTIRQDRAVN